MTAAHPQPPFDGEPAAPRQDLADGDRKARDPQAQSSKWQQFIDTIRPRYILSMANGYPVVVKQFIQFCLILIYPGWVFTVLVGGFLTLLFYATIYPLLWLLFWPVRAHQKKHHPEEYAANRAKYAKQSIW